MKRMKTKHDFSSMKTLSVAAMLSLWIAVAMLGPCEAFWTTANGQRKTQILAMANQQPTTKGMDRVAVVQTGFGCCHGRNPTKAAVRACRNAIDSNSVKIRTIIPGGYDAMKIHVQVGVPTSDIGEVDMESIKAEFPYGQLLPIEIQTGGMLASNGVWKAGVAEPKDDMTLAVVCVTIGYDE